jgi:UDP-3-O-[3-hydroxymyristoyl] glucosamine N-acyltransferase
MKFPEPVTVSTVAEWIGGKVIGDPACLVSGINEIHRVKEGDLCFVDHPKYYKRAFQSPARAIIINDEEQEPPSGKVLIYHPQPFRAFNQILSRFRPIVFPKAYSSRPEKMGSNVQIGENTVFGIGVEVGDNVVIGPNVSIGSWVTIGDHTVIYPGVKIGDHVSIGKYCEIESGAVIGSLPFYFKKEREEVVRMHRGGSVVIEDHVSIGANTTIDAGVSAETRIGAYTKIDNLVQIGHDTIIGKRCIIAAQVGIAGCSVIEDEVTLWGQVGIPSGVTIGRNATLLAKAGVIASLPPEKTYFGFIAKEYQRSIRAYHLLYKLPEIFPRIAKWLFMEEEK